MQGEKRPGLVIQKFYINETQQSDVFINENKKGV